MTNDFGRDIAWSVGSIAFAATAQVLWVCSIDAMHLKRWQKVVALLLLQTMIVRAFVVELLQPRLSTAEVCVVFCASLRAIAQSLLLNVAAFLGKQLVITVRGEQLAVVRRRPRILAHQ